MTACINHTNGDQAQSAAVVILPRPSGRTSVNQGNKATTVLCTLMYRKVQKNQPHRALVWPAATQGVVRVLQNHHDGTTSQKLAHMQASKRTQGFQAMCSF